MTLKPSIAQTIDRRPGIMPGEPSSEPTGDQKQIYMDYLYR